MITASSLATHSRARATLGLLRTSSRGTILTIVGLVSAGVLAGPVTLDNGVVGDGHLNVTVDDWGSFGDAFGGGPQWLDLFNPSPDPNEGELGEEFPTFSTNIYLFIDPSGVGNGTHRIALSSHGGIVTTYPDPTFDCIVDQQNSTDGLPLSTNSIFSCTGSDVALNITLTQTVRALIPGPASEQRAELEQAYVIANSGPPIDLIITKHIDECIPWGGGGAFHLDDIVGVDFLELGRPKVYALDRELTTAAFVLRTREDMRLDPLTAEGGFIYYVGKQNMPAPPGNPDYPGGNCPVQDYGTDLQIWDNYGVPNCWKNFVGSVGYDISGATPLVVSGGSFIGLQATASLLSGSQYSITFLTSYGSMFSECDPSGGSGLDCNGNGILDDCETDCQPNGIPDECDISAGTSQDCNGNGLPDECSPDTDGDGEVDDCDADDDNDGVPDQNDPSRVNPQVCGDTDGDECDDCAIGVDGFGSLPDGDPTNDGVDSDGDGFCDIGDPCPLDNPDDTDGDGVCDVLDACPGEDDTVDPDNDGVPTACDNCPGDSNSDQSDCDGDGVGDVCAIAGGASQDCNSNTVPDNCENDCNCNGIDDFTDVAAQTSDDCNGNEMPDECETVRATVESPPLSPFGIGFPVSYTWASPPGMSGDLVLIFSATGDLESPSEAVNVDLNGVFVGTVFGVGAADCPAVADTDQLPVSAGDFNSVVGGGDAVIGMVTTIAVDPFLCPSSIAVSIAYPVVSANDCNGNGVPDSCDILTGESQDLNGNGLLDECDACLLAGDCGDLDANNITDSPCVWWECVDESCSGVAKSAPSDMGGSFGACAADGFCNVHDRNHALNCFSGQNICPDINVDAGGAFGDCVPDGFCNIHDANHATSCFSGTNPCGCPSGPAPENGRNVEGEAIITVASDARRIDAEGEFSVRVFVTNQNPERERGVSPQSYQLHVSTSGGRSGHLELIDITIEDRPDYVFARADDTFAAFNIETAQMLAGTDTGALRKTRRGYLATFTYRASADAAGVFVIDVLHDETTGNQTFLIGSKHTDQIAVRATVPAIVTVTPSAADANSANAR